MTRPLGCTHLLWPSCGCVEPPTFATHLIVERDKKEREAAAEASKPKKRGRPKTPWARDPEDKPKTEDDLFLEALPAALEDPYSRAALLKAVDAQIARGSLSEFVRLGWHVIEPSTKLEWNWHHELICNILQGIFEDWERTQDDEIYRQRVRNCVMNVPPGSLKSRLVAVFFPVWCWLRRPGCKFICLSVNEDAAMRDARDSLSLIKSDWFQTMFNPDWTIRADQGAISNYANTSGGVRLSRAQGSEIVGLRADILLVDDANNPKEAESKLVRESVNDLYTTNIHNRVNHPEHSIRIGIQQRTHTEDWTGYIVKRDGVWTPEDPNLHKWLHVIIPAEFEPERKCVTPWGEDPRTYKGETLHPVRMSADFIAAEKKRFGAQKYAGQMQQRPSLAEGAMVKMRWWRFFYLDQLQVPLLPEDRAKGWQSGADEIDRSHLAIPVKRMHMSHRWQFDWTVISIDAAAKKTERGSQYGILVLAGKGPQRFILDDKTTRGDVLEVLSIIEALCKKWDPNRIIIEAKAAGPALMTLFEERFQRGKIVGSNGKPLMVILDSIEPQGDKAARLDACLPELESGLVHLMDGAEWLEEFCGEVCGFPVATYDDRVDALSQALNHMRAWGNYQLPKW